MKNKGGIKMALVTTTEMFKKAYGHYAVGAFNVNNMEIIQGITEAAKEENSPVILQVSAGARQAAISSGKVDAVFWTRSIYNLKREILPYPLDKMAGVVISEPYLLEGRATVSIRKEQ